MATQGAKVSFLDQFTVLRGRWTSSKSITLQLFRSFFFSHLNKPPSTVPCRLLIAEFCRVLADGRPCTAPSAS